ncbi:MAG TPA: hypothetical protein VFP93_00455, partial [Gammaproteobacteria bacterium]|nr:hypothetical protein [Gammaproteobacteria bacterium]
MHEWLGQIAQAGLKIKDDGLGEILLKVKNTKPKSQENAIHYLMSWAAKVITTTTVIFAFTAMTNPIVGAFVGIATYFGTRDATAFGTFDLAEWFWKEGRWSITDKFLTLKNLSFKESLKATALLVCTGALAYMGAQAVFASVIGLTVLAGLNIVAVQAIAWGASLWSFAASVIGLSGAIRVLTGFGFHNNQIDPIEMQSATLPTLEEGTLAKLNHLKQKYNRALRDQELLHNPGLRFTKPANESVTQEADTHASTLKKKAL